jgi:elongation factor G
MGELHLEILLDRLKREFKVECNQGAPQVAYKETITGVVDHREVYKKQTGGRGKFADIIVKIQGVSEGKEGLEFVNEVKGGNIPREFVPSVEKGFRESMKNGVLAGFPLVGMKVSLIDGSYHAVDSDSLSFELCAKVAYREALPKARPVLLEPIMKLEVVTPEENMGDVVGDLNRRRGVVNGMDDRSGAKVVKANVPLSEMFGYVTSLRTISSGRASSTMEFSHYEPCPNNIADEVIAKVKGKVAAK